MLVRCSVLNPPTLPVVLLPLPHPFRLAVFSVSVLKLERVVVVAEQKPNCTDEQAFTWMNSVVPAIESIHSINLYGLILVKAGHLPRVGVVCEIWAPLWSGCGL